MTLYHRELVDLDHPEEGSLMIEIWLKSAKPPIVPPEEIKKFVENHRKQCLEKQAQQQDH